MRGCTSAITVLLAVAVASGAAAMEGGWTPGPTMPTARAGHQSLVLADGSLLVVGGYSAVLPVTEATTVARLDPSLGSWSTLTDLGRGHARACVLSDGRVLVTGGIAAGAMAARCDLYDPVTHAWARTGDLALPRAYHVCEALPTGGAVVIGGRTDGAGDASWLTSIERFDPSSGAWTTVSPAQTAGAVSVVLQGQVLALGGTSAASSGSVSSAGVLFDPISGNARGTADMGAGYLSFALTALGDGSALRTGGQAFNGPEATASVYGPATDSWTATAPMTIGRSNHAAVLLGDGSVLVAGGITGQSPSAETWSPTTGVWTEAPALHDDRQDLALSRVSGSKLVATGGYIGGEASATTEIFTPAGVQVAVTSSAASATNAEPIPISVHFARAVTGFTIDDLSVTNGTASGLTGSGGDYAVTLTPAADGPVTVAISDGAAIDSAGNPSVASSLTRIFDRTPPSLAITAPVISGASARWEIDYPDAASVRLTAAQVSLITTGTATGAIAVSGSGAGPRTITVGAISGDGTIAIDIAPDSARDAAGNSALASGPSQSVAVHDGEQPAVVPPTAPMVRASTSGGGGGGGGCGLGAGATTIAAALALGLGRFRRISPAANR